MWATPRLASSPDDGNAGRLNTSMERAVPLEAFDRIDSLIKPGLAGRAGFPAFVDPEPLVRVSPNQFFNLNSKPGRDIDDVALPVAAVLRFDQFAVHADVFPGSFVPDAGERDDDRICPDREHGRTCRSARRHTEEGDEDALLRVRVHVREDPENSCSAKHLYRGRDRVRFVDRPCTKT